MRRLARVCAVTVIAFLASFSWAAVYPYAIFSAVGDILWASFFAFFLWAFLLASPNWRQVALSFGIISAVAGVVSVAWSALSWRFGLWFPEFPGLLHWIFSTDGEASYNASDAQLFLVIFFALSAAFLGFRLSRTKDKTRVFEKGIKQ